MTVTDPTQLAMRMNVIEVLYEEFPDYPPERIAIMVLILEEEMAYKMAGVPLDD